MKTRLLWSHDTINIVILNEVNIEIFIMVLTNWKLGYYGHMIQPNIVINFCNFEDIHCDYIILITLKVIIVMQYKQIWIT